LTGTIILDEVFAQDPEALYRRMRTESPVCEVELTGGERGWLVTRYADVIALLKDPRVTNDPTKVLPYYPPDRVKPYFSPELRTMLEQDPPAHARLRKLVVKAFTARAVQRMQPIIETIADELLDAIDLRAAAGPVDLIANYAEPLPIRVIGELMGLPPRYAPAFQSAVRPFSMITTDDVKATAAQQTLGILNELIEQKTHQPGEDLLSALINASVDGDELTRDELLAMCFLLIAAGYETTVKLIGNGTLALLRNPAQMEKLRTDPALIPNAVEEMLRFDGPVNIATLRLTTAAIDVDGVVIPAHEQVLISLLSANRDDARFPDADRFDIARDTRGHTAFGHGIHFCIGAPLARMEGATAIGRLINRYEHITLDDTEALRYLDSALNHGLESLPVWLRHGNGTPTA
jgi:cytochrome P450